MSKITAVLFCLAALVVAQPFDAADEVVLNFSPDSVTAIALELDAGNIQLSAGEGAITVRVARHCQADEEESAQQGLETITVGSELNDDELDVTVELPEELPGCDAAVTISAPAGTAVSLSTETGNVTVYGMTAGVEATTQAGAIRLTNTGGRAELETGSGEVNVSTHAGGILARTGTGSITCTITAVDERETVTLETAAGAVTLRLPADVSAHIDAATQAGTVSVYGFEAIWDTETDKAVVGTVLYGDTEVMVRSGAGNISIGTQ